MSASSQNCQKKKAIILGSGPYCIGSSVEFDWGCVNAVKALQENDYETVMINYNPETVSTDYNTCEKLYFDELSLERVLDIYEAENPDGVVVYTGGQVPNNLSKRLGEEKVPLIGTEAENIDRAESRHIFSSLLDKLDIDQPQWKEFTDLDALENFSETVGFPVLVRPSYVLSGAAMAVAWNKEELENFLGKASKISTEAPVVVSKFEVGAREIEIDAVASKGEIAIYAISEHVENAGVHSGDATVVLPPQKTYLETVRRIKEVAKKLAKELDITGPFNMQFLAKNNEIKVIELNLRSSRSFPFVSKTTGHNFIRIATEAAIAKLEKRAFQHEEFNTLDFDYVGVKAPQFSFSRLRGADPVLSVEMSSTGEVGCFGKSLEEAFLKSMISTGFRIPKKNIFLSIGRIEDKAAFLPFAKELVEMGYELSGTFGTADFLREAGLSIEKVADKDALGEVQKSDMLINIPRNYAHEEKTRGYEIRRAAIDGNISLITNIQIAKQVVQSLKKFPTTKDLPMTSWDEFVELNK
jgi:carbamoyl-phosphate synthase large subunit